VVNLSDFVLDFHCSTFDALGKLNSEALQNFEFLIKFIFLTGNVGFLVVGIRKDFDVDVHFGGGG